MPTCRRKRVLLIETPPSLLQALKSDPKKHVYYLTKTGEIFDTYEQASIPPLLHLQT
jgi:bromodomain adjacent to zinc finger domain protein 1A